MSDQNRLPKINLLRGVAPVQGVTSGKSTTRIQPSNRPSGQDAPQGAASFGGHSPRASNSRGHSAVQLGYEPKRHGAHIDLSSSSAQPSAPAASSSRPWVPGGWVPGFSQIAGQGGAHEEEAPPEMTLEEAIASLPPLSAEHRYLQAHELEWLAQRGYEVEVGSIIDASQPDVTLPPPPPETIQMPIQPAAAEAAAPAGWGPGSPVSYAPPPAGPSAMPPPPQAFVSGPPVDARIEVTQPLPQGDPLPISVITTHWRRTSLLDPQIKALRGSTRPPRQVAVVARNGGVPMNEPLLAQLPTIRASSDQGMWAVIAHALTAEGDAIVIMDETLLPGRRWLECAFEELTRTGCVVAAYGDRVLRGTALAEHERIEPTDEVQAVPVGEGAWMLTREVLMHAVASSYLGNPQYGWQLHLALAAQRADKRTVILPAGEHRDPLVYSIQDDPGIREATGKERLAIIQAYEARGLKLDA